MDFYTFTVGFLAASLLAILIFYLIYDHTTKYWQNAYETLLRQSRGVQERYAELDEVHRTTKQTLERVETQKRFLEEKIAFWEKRHEEVEKRFEDIARKVIEERSETLDKKQRESLRTLLSPFAENIKTFQQKVERFYMEESRERYSLIKEIAALKSLNERLSQDALNLTNALKGDNKLQGNWGEMILEKVLESSGLTKGREYEVQKVCSDEAGRRYRPDVIVHLPDKKDVVIDAKVSLKAYEAYSSADDEEMRRKHLKAHLDSIYLHIKTLSEKRYETLEGIRTLDFVLLFIPVEAAFMKAVEADSDLYEKAYRKNIIIVSPSTLLAVLRTIEHAWRYEYQNKNAREIAKKAGDLYEKFRGFLESMQTIEKSLHKAQEAYEEAYRRLSSGKGNLISRAEALRKMDGITLKRPKEQREG